MTNQKLSAFERVAQMKPGETWVYYEGGSLGRAARKDISIEATQLGVVAAYHKGLCDLTQKRVSWGETRVIGDKICHNVGSSFEYRATRK